MRVTHALCLAATLAACRPRHRASDAGDDGDARNTATMPTTNTDVVPVRAGDGSQPRWRYLARGAPLRGVERWRYDLTPRVPSGEAATDGRTVFVSAVRDEPEGPTDGEVFAFDLLDGTLRWHTPVGGLHGEPIEVLDGLVLVDTLTHCIARGPETPGVPLRPCLDTRPGGLVALDASTGHVRAHTTVSSDAIRAQWTGLAVGGALWMHDGSNALRAITLPTLTPGARLATNATTLNLATLGGDLLFTLRGALGTTRLVRRTPGVARPRWERPLPLHTHCPLLTAGPLLVLPAFANTAGAGGLRAVLTGDAVDVWTTDAPHRVSSCAMMEGGNVYQVIDGALVGHHVIDGRRRAQHALPDAPTSDAAALVDGVFYAGLRGRVVGLDVTDGRASVTLTTGADAAESVIVWGGHAVVAARDPALVLGFE